MLFSRRSSASWLRRSELIGRAPDVHTAKPRTNRIEGPCLIGYPPVAVLLLLHLWDGELELAVVERRVWCGVQRIRVAGDGVHAGTLSGVRKHLSYEQRLRVDPDCDRPHVGDGTAGIDRARDAD